MAESAMTYSWLYYLGGIVVIILFFSGIKIVRPIYRGLIERFGKYNRFANPGFHWIFPGLKRCI